MVNNIQEIHCSGEQNIINRDYWFIILIAYSFYALGILANTTITRQGGSYIVFIVTLLLLIKNIKLEINCQRKLCTILKKVYIKTGEF